MTSNPALEVSDVFAGYGKSMVLHGVSLVANEGEIVSLLGANGAGKTTTLGCVSGLVPIGRGVVRLFGNRIDGMPSHTRATKGLAHVPEGRRVFPRLTVWENLVLGGYQLKSRDVLRERIEHVLEIFPQLCDRRGQMAGTLSGGEQQMLAIGRGMVSNPRVLLVDEPSLGLAPKLIPPIFDVLAGIASRGTSVLLVEQNARLALRYSSRAYLLRAGQIVASGGSDQIANDEELLSGFLGTVHAASAGPEGGAEGL